jgi:hypothetical protein
MLLNNRFETKISNHHWMHTGPPGFTNGTTARGKLIESRVKLNELDVLKPKSDESPKSNTKLTDQLRSFDWSKKETQNLYQNRSVKSEKSAPQSADDIVNILFPDQPRPKRPRIHKEKFQANPHAFAPWEK